VWLEIINRNFEILDQIINVHLVKMVMRDILIWMSIWHLTQINIFTLLVNIAHFFQILFTYIISDLLAARNFGVMLFFIKP
jgi:hypothetical protein